MLRENGTYYFFSSRTHGWYSSDTDYKAASTLAEHRADSDGVDGDGNHRSIISPPGWGHSGFYQLSHAASGVYDVTTPRP